MRGKDFALNKQSIFDVAVLLSLTLSACGILGRFEAEYIIARLFAVEFSRTELATKIGICFVVEMKKTARRSNS